MSNKTINDNREGKKKSEIVDEEITHMVTVLGGEIFKSIERLTEIGLNERSIYIAQSRIIISMMSNIIRAFIIEDSQAFFMRKTADLLNDLAQFMGDRRKDEKND